MRKKRRKKRSEQREKDKCEEFIKEIKKNCLPYDMIIYEILSFLEIDAEDLKIYHSLVDSSITRSKKYGCMYTGNSISKYIRLKHRNQREKIKKRINALYGYFSSDGCRRIFLVFRSLKIDFSGVGYYAIVEIKRLCSLRLIQVEGLHVINGVKNLYIEGSKESILLTRSMSNVKNLKIQNFQQLNSISNIPNVENLTLIDCGYITSINNLPNLRVLKIWLCGMPKIMIESKHSFLFLIYNYGVPGGPKVKSKIDHSLIRIKNLPKLEILNTYSEMTESNEPNKIILPSYEIEGRINTGLIKYKENPYLFDIKIKNLSFVC
jgi:hypothetical protein